MSIDFYVRRFKRLSAQYKDIPLITINLYPYDQSYPPIVTHLLHGSHKDYDVDSNFIDIFSDAAIPDDLITKFTGPILKLLVAGIKAQKLKLKEGDFSLEYEVLAPLILSEHQQLTEMVVELGPQFVSHSLHYLTCKPKLRDMLQYTLFAATEITETNFNSLIQPELDPLPLPLTARNR